LQNNELTDIEASVQTLVRRTYDLGRNDALKKVVAVLHGDRPIAEQLALMGPEGQGHEIGLHQVMNGSQPASTSRPWWAWPVR
jgi:hypothetical protein